MTTTTDRDECLEAARSFLTALFGADELEEQRIALWTLCDRRSAYFATAAAAAAYALRRRDDSDVYVGCCLAPPGLSAAERPGAAQVTTMPGLWIDLDVQGPGHRKTGLPPDAAACLDLLGELPLPPGIVVHSGGGVQAWWPFREPWTLDDPTERAAAARLVQRWQATIRRRAACHGWTVDATHDLARLLRLPGTLNRKTTPPRPVRLLTLDEARRVDPSDVEPFLADDEHEAAAPALGLVAGGTGRTDLAIPGGGEGASLVLDPAAAPDPELLTALFSLTPHALDSLNHTRKDAKGWTDQSDSAYDFSLAVLAAEGGWPDQQIANLLILHRRRHGALAKVMRGGALRRDYFERTIARARTRLIERERQRQAEAVLAGLAAPAELEGGAEIEAPADRGSGAWVEPPAAPTDGAAGATATAAPAAAVPADGAATPRTELLRALSTRLGLAIERVVQQRGDPPTYRITVGGVDVPLGGSGALLNQSVFQRRIADALLVYVDKVKDWGPIARSLLAVCETVESGHEKDELSEVAAVVEQYLDEHTIYAGAKSWWEDGATNYLPFIRAGAVHLSTSGNGGLVFWAQRMCGVRLTSRDLSKLLPWLGWEPGIVSWRDGQGRTRSRRVYRRPLDAFDRATLQISSEDGREPDAEPDAAEPATEAGTGVTE